MYLPTSSTNSPIPTPDTTAATDRAHRLAHTSGTIAPTISKTPPHSAWAMWGGAAPDLWVAGQRQEQPDGDDRDAESDDE